MNPKNTINTGWILMCMIIGFCTGCSSLNKALTRPKKKDIPDKPYIYKNEDIELDITGLNKEDRKAIKSRLLTQLEDSAKVTIVDKFFIFHRIKNPNIFDTVWLKQSAVNMRSSMLHLGYYNAQASYSYRIDSTFSKKEKRVYVTYKIKANKPTRIEKISYNLKRDELQKLAEKNMPGLLRKGDPVTKANVTGELSRLVDIYRNEGYYKFTTDELRVLGDSAIEILTTISDDPFEQLEALQRAQAKRDSPTVKLAVVLNTPKDSSRIRPYRVGNIYILTDYKPGDKHTDTSIVEEAIPIRKCDTCAWVNGVFIRSRFDMFKDDFVVQNLALWPGDLLKQNLFQQTFSNFTRAGVWASSNILVLERKDSSYKADLVVQLIPGKQFDFESSLETSYSSNSNTNSVNISPAGNLLGLVANASISNKNWLKQGIRMTNSVSAGIELNLKNRTNSNEFINSNDIRVSNSISIPKYLLLFKKLLPNATNKTTYINTSVSYVNRISLFKLQNINFSYGITGQLKNTLVSFKLLNFQYSYLYDKTALFEQTLDLNPFLRYSFNTASVAGLAGSVSRSWLKSNARKNTLNVNGDFSIIPIIPKYHRSFAKVDAEYIHSKSWRKTALISRIFLGVGVPLAKKDTTLPFFKQYFGGGSNSMRGWPVRGIGLGSQPLKPFNAIAFNDRTGDMQFETNVEFRGDIARAFGDAVFFKYAVFADVGNIWNTKNSRAAGVDSALFRFKNFYKELGVSAGAGLRLDFTYFIIRLDMGFRIKRPEISGINDGWKLPSVGFDDFIKKIFTKGPDGEYRRWRYENYNFTLGINYPF